MSNRKRLVNIRSVGASRSPGGDRRGARNSDVDTNPLAIARDVASVEFPPFVPQTVTPATLSDLTELNDRIRTMEAAHNALLASLREGQVIGG